MTSESKEEDLDAFLSVVYKCKKCPVELCSKEEMLEHVKNLHNFPAVDKSDACREEHQNFSSIEHDDLTDRESVNSERKNTCRKLSQSDAIAMKRMKPSYKDRQQQQTVQRAIEQDADRSDDDLELSWNTSAPIQVEVVDSSSSLKCPSCNKKFKQKRSLENHCKKVHKKKSFICPKCRVRSKGREEHQLHVLAHYKDTFKCVMCDYTNSQWHRLKVHMETHNQPDKYACDSCELTFASPFALCNHKRFAHLGGFHLCDECGFNAPSKYALVQHRMQTHDNLYYCQICNHRCDNQLDLEEHIKARHQNSYVCKSCSTSKTQPIEMKFSSQQDLLAHMATVHPNDKCFFCEKCNYVAKLRHHLKKHMLMHTGEKPHKCKFEGCDFSTKDHKNLKQHMVMKHRKPGELVCRQCRFVTTNQNEWDVHKAIKHMQIFKCNLCDYTSNNSATIRRHRIAKHVTGDKMRYPCPQCSYRTNLKECLQKHVLTHAIKDSQFACLLCDQTFFDRKSTERHLVEEHASEAIFLCSKCPYMTQTERGLARHFAIHEQRQVKPFKCDQCPYAGRTSTLLKSHKANKHKEKWFDPHEAGPATAEQPSSTSRIENPRESHYAELQPVSSLLDHQHQVTIESVPQAPVT